MNDLIFYRFQVYRLTPAVNEGISSLTKETIPGQLNSVEILKNTYSAKIFAAVTELQKKIKKARPLFSQDALKHLNKLSDDIDETSANFTKNINASKEKYKIAISYQTAKDELIKSNEQINQIFFGGNMLNKILFNNPENKITQTPENTKYLVLNELAEKNVRTEAFMLLTIIEKYWSKAEADRQFKLSSKQTKFDINQLRNFFSRENNSHLKVGFIYFYSTIPKLKNRMLFSLIYENDRGKGFLNTLPNLLERLKELSKGKNIERILPDMEKAKKEAGTMETNKTKQELLNTLKSQNLFTNKWQALPDSLSGKMAVVYGRGCGNYLYRYVPEKNTVLIVRIQNGAVKDSSPHFGGEIYLGNPSHKTYGIWQSYNMANTVKMLNYYLIKPELQKYITERAKGNQNARG